MVRPVPLSAEPLLITKPRLPVCRHASGGAGHRLIERMRMRGMQGGADEELVRSKVVKPLLAGLKARDNRVTRIGVMSRCMLTW